MLDVPAMGFQESGNLHIALADPTGEFFDVLSPVLEQAVGLAKALQRSLGFVHLLAAHEGIEDIRWFRKCWRQLSVLQGQVEAVQSVVVDEAIPLPGQQRLPLGVVASPRIGLGCFHQNDPRAQHTQVDAAQHVGLGAFGVDFEKVDLRDALLGTDGIEAAHSNLARGEDGQSLLAVLARELGAGGRQSAALDLEKIDRCLARARRHAQVDIARP